MAGQVERTLRPEDQIAHYRIVSPLGAGGMGEVYLAQDRTLERNVALKILPPELVKDEDRVRRFGLEAKSASSLSHPNIVTIYEIGHDVVRSAGAPDSSPVHYISMELVSGKTLGALIHEERTDLRTLVGYLAQAAEGLAKAHAAGIVHRDLKPGNIMVSADGFAKVLDFGLAKLLEKRDASGESDIAEEPTMARDSSRVGSVVGTAGYMSPEQIQGKAVDHRSDIFSFGCILYEAATRKKPFAAETGIETMHKVLNEKPVPVEELNDKVPAELRRLVKRCLAKSPDQRVQSAKDLAIELREIADEYDSLSASATSTTHASGTAVAPRPAPAFGRPALAAAALVVAALAAFALLHFRRSTSAPPPTTAFQSMRMSVQTSRGDVYEAALSPDGRYLAYLAGTAGRVGLRVRQVATGSDVEVLPTRDAALEGPAFSPDGNYVLYLARKPDNPNYRILFEVASLGGTPRERAFDVDSRVCFSPDGKRIAFWRRVNSEKQSRLVVLELEASKERVLGTVNDPESYQGGPSWSPDGRTIAVALLRPAPEFRATVSLFDVGSGERRDLLALPSTILNSVAWLPDGKGLAASAQNLTTSINQQVVLIGYPDARMQRVTNDFYRYVGISVSRGEEDAIAAVRYSRLANLWIADAAGGPARQITSTVNPEESHFFVSVAAPETLLYDAPRDQSVQVFALPATGGEPQPLTTGEALSVNPRAAGRLVVFDRLDATGVHIWSMGTDGRSPRKLTSGGGSLAAVTSPDGRFVAFVPVDAPQSVSLIALETGQVTPLAAKVTGIVGFSPDSSKLLLVRVEPDASGLGRTLLQAVPVGGGPELATFKPPGEAMEPAWAPDGQAVTFRDRSDPAWNIYRLDASGQKPTPVTHLTDGRTTGYAWSPDGSRLALVRRGDDGQNVWVAGRDGSRPIQITRFSATDVYFVRWLPDNRRLAVSAGKLSRDAVLIKSFR
jgi:serine/threonine protein kinase/Tol biopolymer transport system component